MGEIKAEARLRMAASEASSARDAVREFCDEMEHGRAGAPVDAETMFFLLDQAQSALARARSHVEKHFEQRSDS